MAELGSSALDGSILALYSRCFDPKLTSANGSYAARILKGPEIERENSYLDAGKGGSNARCGIRSCVHPLHICQQIGTTIEQPDLVRPVERIGTHDVRNGKIVANHETAALHMTLQHRGHFFEILSSKRHLAQEAQMYRIQSCVARDAPQRLFQLRSREQKPTINVRAQLEVRGNQALAGILLGQVEHDGHRLGQYQVAIDKHGNPSSGVYLEKRRAAMFVSHEIDSNCFEVDSQLLECPAHTDRACRSELVQFHHMLSRSIARQRNRFLAHSFSIMDHQNRPHLDCTFRACTRRSRDEPHNLI